MRKWIVLFLGIMFIAGTCNEEIEEKEKLSETLKEIIMEIRKGCVNNDYEYASKFIVYRGDDPNRKWKDVVNYMNPPEHSLVASVCSKLNKAFGTANHFDLAGYGSETESEGTWHSIRAMFVDNGQKRECTFSFLYIKDQYALGDIDFD